MNEFSTYEFVVKQKSEGKWLLGRIGLIALYVLYVLTLLLVGLQARIVVPLLALIPITLWILIFITWRYVSVEYEYSITSGVLTFTKIYGGRSRKRVLELPLRDAVRIAPLDNSMEADRAQHYKPEREFSAISSLRAPDIYFILFELDAERNKDKRRAILYLEATQKALHIFKYYNASATVVQQVTR
ncbi:MAG: hypothetical protein E7644_00710 [Ruminococcaceae bacterium]|nr:hypothetical protein [Oscillospiraceae bacterium]